MTTGDDLISAAAAAYTGLPIKLDPAPADGSQRRGFSYDDGPVKVSGLFAIRGGAAKLTSVTISSTEDHLSAATIRDLPYGRITGSLTALTDLETAGREGMGVAYPKAASAARKAVHKGGPPRVSDTHLANLSEAYLRETTPGSAPRPTGRLAADFGAPENTIRTWLSRARKDGWLTASVKGRAGAEPGPRLLLWRMQQEGPKEG